MTEQRFQYRWIDNRLLLGGVIASLALFVGQTFSTSPTCLTFVLAALMIGILLDNRRLRLASTLPTTSSSTPTKRESKIQWRTIGRRLVVGFTLIAALLVTFSWRMAHGITDASSILLLAVDLIAHYCVTVLCILWAIWPHRGHVTMLVVGLIAIMVTIAGGGVSRSLPAQTAVGLASMIGFVISAQIILSRQKRPYTVTEKHDRGFHFERWPYTLFTLSLVLIAASAITQVTGVVLPDLQAEVFAQLKDRFEDADTSLPISSSGYVSGHRLGSVRKSMLSDPEGIALLGYCGASPGYLRGNVFDDYHERSWRSQRRWIQRNQDGSVGRVYRAQRAERISEARVPLVRSGGSNRYRFSLSVSGSSGPVAGLKMFERDGSRNTSRTDAKETVTDQSDFVANNQSGPNLVATVELHGQPERGAMIFLPSAAFWIEARGERVGITSHGLIDRGIDTSQPWVAGVAAEPEQEELSPAALELLTSVDAELRNSIAPIASKVCKGAASSRGKADRIASYFQNNFQYTLQTEAAPSGLDPITYFLRTRHPAHCELFASASTLMLRSQGVPARYVTGYVMDEMSDSGDYYIARNRDAHAWVEYYDDQRQRWYSLESTPGRVYQTIDLSSQTLAQSDFNLTSLDEEFAAAHWVRTLWGNLMSLRVTDALAMIFRVLQLPLLFALTGWLWWRRRTGNADANAAALASARRTMDRRLRRLGWVRRQSETLHQFARRIEPQPSETVSDKERHRREQLADAARWYREHAVKLYRCS
ncbi:hypothetical protein FHS27_001451 [Rhodopirellula rubra]|uniref:Transglutaminase-like domain-containing protein n=1 Tax=Aporhodopirellula rubra TaxID=980271 RepID=A0A7W5DWV7_9BACT|nr:transglutaminase domain-containing protein [Aporhodopirellula rubra]MBB3205647.1 hypothetical protein [Aporhodopirellula rubra]